jgi:RNA polymerase sigma factor (sigma-70 family)
MIRVEDWQDLAWKHVLRYKGRTGGLDLDDLFQMAMIGLIKASKGYNKTYGSFYAYSFPFVNGEIGDTLYRRVVTDGEVNHQYKTDYILECDIDVDDFDVSTEDTVEDDLFISSYLTGLPLEGEDRDFFNDILIHGDKEAVIMYMVTNKCTRQVANKNKLRIRNIAAQYYKELTDNDSSN